MLAAAALLASCAQEPAGPSAPLQDTFWRTVEIEGVPYAPRPGVREPYLLFARDRVTGFTGCNNLTGGYEQDAARLRFKPVAMTRMACLPDNDLETRFVSAINATTSQRITGSRLELLDGTGRTRMRLEARDPR
ncbi:MAG TPA: META domain-containing protein [Steroidobacteraceae bacterium]